MSETVNIIASLDVPKAKADEVKAELTAYLDQVVKNVSGSTIRMIDVRDVVLTTRAQRFGLSKSAETQTLQKAANSRIQDPEFLDPPKSSSGSE